jgi:hypothetical protein
MKTILLYRPNSDHERLVTDYVRDVKMQTGKEVPLLDVDSKEGIALCEVYSIMQYPAILVTDDTGHMQSLWTGTTLPRIGELGYYINDDGLSTRTHSKIIPLPHDKKD